MVYLLEQEFMILNVSPMCGLEANGVRDSDAELWFKGQKAEIDHNINI